MRTQHSTAFRLSCPWPLIGFISIVVDLIEYLVSLQGTGAAWLGSRMRMPFYSREQPVSVNLEKGKTTQKNTKKKQKKKHTHETKQKKQTTKKNTVGQQITYK